MRFRHYNERGLQFQEGPQAFIISGPVRTLLIHFEFFGLLPVCFIDQIVRIGENSIDLHSPVLDANDYDAVGEAKTVSLPS